ncbi:MAG TPA: lipoprotein-releasing ABC transporter permease subunit [Steroidobacteraceae bacterium]|nr:lipoprotein-releasing ABC transporter permease subunit [Steroidobacteraceae bacterium]
MAFTGTYEWLIGARYLRSGHRRGFLSFITGISIAGLALGVAVLLVVMSVMNGFEKELRARILNVTAHATLTGPQETLPDWREAQRRGLALPGVIAVTPYIETRAMLAAGERLAGSQLRGVDPAQEKALNGLASVMTVGRLEDLTAGSWGVILGEALAAELRVKVGDSVVVIVPKGTVTPVGIVPHMRSFTVVGLFRSGMYEYDRGLALLNVGDAAKLLHYGDAMTGVRLQLADPFTDLLAARHAVRELALQLGNGYYVSDWTRVHANFFRSIQMTKSMLFVILSMIVAIAAFNIVATLVMVVKEKEGDIAILRTFGAAPVNVLRMFGVQGACIGLAGVALGLGSGALLSVNLEALVHGLEHLTGFHFLDAKVYFMSDLPAEVRLHDALKVALMALLLCLVATIYPAWRAARVLPAEALRHD